MYTASADKGPVHQLWQSLVVWIIGFTKHGTVQVGLAEVLILTFVHFSKVRLTITKPWNHSTKTNEHVIHHKVMDYMAHIECPSIMSYKNQFFTTACFDSFESIQAFLKGFKAADSKKNHLFI